MSRLDCKPKRMNHIHEPLTNFTIVIQLDNGDFMEVRSLGVSEWHAKDKAHTKYLEVQKDISKYSVKKPLLSIL